MKLEVELLVPADRDPLLYRANAARRASALGFPRPHSKRLSLAPHAPSPLLPGNCPTPPTRGPWWTCSPGNFTFGIFRPGDARSGRRAAKMNSNETLRRSKLWSPTLRPESVPGAFPAPTTNRHHPGRPPEGIRASRMCNRRLPQPAPRTWLLPDAFGSSAAAPARAWRRWLTVCLRRGPDTTRRRWRAVGPHRCLCPLALRPRDVAGRAQGRPHVGYGSAALLRHACRG